MLKITGLLKKSILKKLGVGDNEFIEFGVGNDEDLLNQKIV